MVARDLEYVSGVLDIDVLRDHVLAEGLEPYQLELVRFADLRMQEKGISRSYGAQDGVCAHQLDGEVGIGYCDVSRVDELETGHEGLVVSIVYHNLAITRFPQTTEGSEEYKVTH